jgi:FKBP-type peptidyl-prolyl cis-trans isomerase SlpA
VVKIRKGHTVTFNCSSYLDNGTQLDDPQDRKPFVMKIGEKSDEPFPKAISEALVGMGINDTKKVTLSPENAFGFHDPKKVMTLPADDGQTFEVGEEVKLRITMNGSNKTQVVEGVVKSVDTTGVKVDINHPFVGRSIIFDLEVLKIA